MRRLLPLIPLALLLAACGGGNDNGSNAASGGSQTIQISEKEYSLNPNAVTVSKPGDYTFEVTNDGQTTHALEIEASGDEDEAKSGNIEPGETKTVQFTVEAGQSYEMYCPIDGHRQQGMEGTVMVAGAPVGTTTNPQGETTTSENNGTSTDDNGGRGY